jgi:Zn-dependent M28 family amino/carboxypeptidase
VPVPFVQTLVNELKRDRLEANLIMLTSFATRHSTGAEYILASNQMRRRLKEMNYQTRLQSVKVNGSKSRNIIADKPGFGSDPRGVVIITAHLDSINLQGGEGAPAPGADDNGSGSAGLLEMARVFQNHQSRHDLRLILFGGEEQGLFGSKHYVAGLSASERARIKAVVNMDMIGCLNSPAQTVLIEGASLSQQVIDGLKQAAVTYTQLAVETSLNPFASDHVPFIRADIPAVLTIEGADSTNIRVHSANDIIHTINYDFALEILRMNVGYAANEIGNSP